MAKYSGKIGYASDDIEIEPGVHETGIVERKYYGDLVKNYSRTQAPEKIVDDVILSNNISIVADPYAFENFYNIRYAELYGTRWSVTSVDVQRPRLVLTLGGPYHGPTP